MGIFVCMTSCFSVIVKIYITLHATAIPTVLAQLKHVFQIYTLCIVHILPFPAKFAIHKDKPLMPLLEWLERRPPKQVSNIKQTTIYEYCLKLAQCFLLQDFGGTTGISKKKHVLTYMILYV